MLHSSLYINKHLYFMSIYSTTKDGSKIFCFEIKEILETLEVITDSANTESSSIEYSYSLDDITWSAYSSDLPVFIANIISTQVDPLLFIKIKISVLLNNSSSVLAFFELTDVKINDISRRVSYVEIAADTGILTTTRTSNLLDPYRKSSQQDILVKKISRSISDIFGFDTTYFRTEPANANYTFQAYTLSNVVEHKPLRIVIKDNYIPDNKTRFAEFDIDFQDELEIHIVKEVFEEVFTGFRPNANDFLWLPLTGQLYQINTIYDFKEFMNESTFYRLMLVKYENRADVKKNDESAIEIDSLIDFDIDFHEDDIAAEKADAVKAFNDVKFTEAENHVSDESLLGQNGSEIFRWSYNFEDIHNFEKVLTYPIDPNKIVSNQFSTIFWVKTNDSQHPQLMTIYDEFDESLLYLSYNNDSNNFNITYHVDGSDYQLSTDANSVDIANRWFGIVVNYVFSDDRKLLSISVYDDELNLVQEVSDTAVLEFTKIKEVNFYGSQHYANIRIAKSTISKPLMPQTLHDMLPKVDNYYVIDNAVPQINNL